MKVSVYHRLRHLLTRHFLLPARVVRPHRSLRGLGLSTPECNEFYCTIEQQFGLDLDDRELQPARTLRELATYVSRVRQARAVAPALI